MSHPYTCVLFDLDGTLLDSAPGITSTLAYTFKELGRPVPSAAELLAYVGPPILDSFRDLAKMTPVEGLHALSIYRHEYLRTGIYKSDPFAGIPHVLRSLHENGVTVSLATSKPEYPSKLMLNHFHLSQYFDVVTGASEDEKRSAKADVVAEAVRRLTAFGADLSRPVMVGDRGTDVAGAAANSIPTIFVSWGYGTADEAARAAATASTPAELQTLLLG
jgi:phosphoglycolate phosphatase